MSLRKLRYFAAGMAGIAAVIYFLIAAHVVQPVDVMDGGMTTFGLMAGAGFALGVLLLLVVRHRAVWILGALLQIMVIAMYFAIGPDRTPHYEFWGLVLRAPQALIFLSLAYLSVSRVPARMKAVAATR